MGLNREIFRPIFWFLFRSWLKCLPKFVTLKAYMKKMVSSLYSTFWIFVEIRSFSYYCLIYAGSGRIIVAGSLGNQTIPEGSALKLTCQVLKLTCQILRITTGQVLRITCEGPKANMSGTHANLPGVQEPPGSSGSRAHLLKTQAHL